MDETACRHDHQATGLIDLDLFRKNGDAQRYTARFSISICPRCGSTFIHCEDARAVCEWLLQTRAPGT